MENYINAYIIERKGTIIKDEMIYGEGIFHRIKIIEYKNNIYWLNKHNGVIIECFKIGEKE